MQAGDQPIGGVAAPDTGEKTPAQAAGIQPRAAQPDFYAGMKKQPDGHFARPAAVLCGKGPLMLSVTDAAADI